PSQYSRRSRSASTPTSDGRRALKRSWATRTAGRPWRASPPRSGRGSAAPRAMWSCCGHAPPRSLARRADRRRRVAVDRPHPRRHRLPIRSAPRLDLPLLPAPPGHRRLVIRHGHRARRARTWPRAAWPGRRALTPCVELCLDRARRHVPRRLPRGAQPSTRRRRAARHLPEPRLRGGPSHGRAAARAAFPPHSVAVPVALAGGGRGDRSRGQYVLAGLRADARALQLDRRAVAVLPAARRTFARADGAHCRASERRSPRRRLGAALRRIGNLVWHLLLQFRTVFGLWEGAIISRALEQGRLWSWSAPGLVVLALGGWWLRRDLREARLLGWSFAATVLGYLPVAFDQGSGWGA